MEIEACTKCKRLEINHPVYSVTKILICEKFTPIQTPQQSKLPAEKTAWVMQSQETPEFVLSGKKFAGDLK